MHACYCHAQVELDRQRELNARMRHELAEQAQAAEEAVQAGEAEHSQLAAAQERIAELEERAQQAERAAAEHAELASQRAQQLAELEGQAGAREAELQVWAAGRAGLTCLLMRLPCAISLAGHWSLLEPRLVSGGFAGAAAAAAPSAVMCRCRLQCCHDVPPWYCRRRTRCSACPRC